LTAQNQAHASRHLIRDPSQTRPLSTTGQDRQRGRAPISSVSSALPKLLSVPDCNKLAEICAQRFARSDLQGRPLGAPHSPPPAPPPPPLHTRARSQPHLLVGVGPPETLDASPVRSEGRAIYIYIERERGGGAALARRRERAAQRQQLQAAALDNGG
jgi:hypothetical protein